MADWRELWVLEWWSTSRNDTWVAIEGSRSPKYLWRKMREGREGWSTDKFRVVKYVPKTEGQK
jgi:hypothetical protein